MDLPMFPMVFPDGPLSTHNFTVFISSYFLYFFKYYYVYDLRVIPYIINGTTTVARVGTSTAGFHIPW